MSACLRARYMKRSNPYIVGNPVGATDAFIGREALLRNISKKILEKNNCGTILYGPRRIGKTSILKELAFRLGDWSGYRHVYLDLLAVSQISMETVLAEFSVAIADGLGIKHHGSTIRCEDDFKRWLVQVLCDKEIRMVLYFDEFDAFESGHSNSAREDFYSFLPNLLNIERDKIRVVVALGRNFSDFGVLDELFNHSFLLERVSLFDSIETEALVRLSEKRECRGVKWSLEAVENLYCKTNGHPMLIQLICSYLLHAFNKTGYEGANEITSEFIEVCFLKIFRKGLNDLDWLWDGLTPYQRFLLAILAESNTEFLTKKRLSVRHCSMKKVDIGGYSFDHSINGLVNWDIIQYVEPEDGFQFRVPIFKEWVKRFYPVERVLLDLAL